MPERINKQNIAEQYATDMVRYSIIADMRRNVPDIRDGLKPIQRRAIFAIDYDLHAVNGKTVKSATAVGQIIGHYSPHGDASAYDAFKPMANWFECKMPYLIAGGSFGSIMGDRQSASRYTETGLTDYAIECIMGGLHDSKAMTDWNPNYNDTRFEPDYLPAIVPNLLINGASGMGVGVKVDIPTYNLVEVIDMTLRLMDNPNTKVVLIPDHCLACDIIDTNWADICKKGYGNYRARGRIQTVIGKVQEDKNHKGNSKIVPTPDGYPYLIINSLPEYGTTAIKDQLETLVEKNICPQIIDINDASATDTGVNILIKLKRGSDTEFVKNAIFKGTDVEKTFTVNFQVVDGLNIGLVSYQKYLLKFIEFAKANKFRYYYNKLADINTRFHKIDAFIKILESGYIDEFIAMLKKRKSTDDQELIEYLIKHAHVTDLQASFIINATLKQLSLGSLNRYKAEAKALDDEMRSYEAIVTNPDLIADKVKEDLLYVRQKYGRPRICNVIKVSDTQDIPKGRFRLIITEGNYVRKLGENDVVNTVRGDKPKFVLNVENTESVLLFGEKGRVFNLLISKVPITARSDQGTDVRTILKGLTTNITTVMYTPWIKRLNDSKQKCYIAVLTKNNTIKKLDIADFVNVPPSGILYSKLNGNDSVVSVQVISDSMDVVIYSDRKALRISAQDINLYKRNTIGVSAMNTTEPILGFSIIYPEATSIVVVTKSGKINRIRTSALNRSNRNKAGSNVIKLGKEDEIYSVIGVPDNAVLNIGTTSDLIKKPVSEIPEGSSISSGTKIVSTRNDSIIEVSLVA